MDFHRPFSVKLSAPGKVILFGEYSVVFKKPAIAATLSLRTKLHFHETNSNEIHLNFSALDLSKSFSVQDIQDFFNIPAGVSWDFYLLSVTKALECLHEKTYEGSKLTNAQKFSLIAFFHCFNKLFKSSRGFCLSINSELPVGSGVGSSASFSVVLSAVALLYEHFCKNRATDDLIEKNNSGQFTILEKFKNEISDLAYSCEKIFHGTPSGVDHSTILNGFIVEFIKSDDNCNKISFINTNSLKILLVNSNVPRSTKTLVSRVKELRQNHPEIVECVLNAIENVAKSAVKDLISFQKNQEKLSQLESHFGDLISLNHSLLRVLGTSHPALEKIVFTANKYNLKAKLTGGGGGGFGFIYIPTSVESSTVEHVEKELIAAGFTVYDVSLGGPGLTIEELIF